MKQWTMPATATDAAGLRFENVVIPEPAPGEVRIRVQALAVNARDTMVLAGPFGRLPGVDVVPISDVSGVIDALGDGVTGWTVGQSVTRVHAPEWAGGAPVPFRIGAGSMDDPGAAAEYICVPAGTVVAAPKNLSAAEAATLQVAGVTAWNALYGDKPVATGDRVLVLGSGGVSLFALQIARAAGAEVYVGVRHGVNDPRWAELGAAAVVDTTETGWGARVAEISGGVTKVVNTVGAGVINDCLAALRGGGEIAVVGLYEPTPPQLDMFSVIGRQLSIRGVAVGSAQMHRDLTQFVETHDIHPIIDRRYPFAALPAAFAEYGAREVFGKVVVDLEEN